MQLPQGAGASENMAGDGVSSHHYLLLRGQLSSSVVGTTEARNRKLPVSFLGDVSSLRLLFFIFLMGKNK